MASAHRRDARRRSTSPGRAATDLFGMLVVVAALLFSPFVYLGLRLDDARRPSPQQAAEIANSNCTQLRAQLDGARADSVNDSSLQLDLSGARAEVLNRIVRRGQELGCRPAIRSPDE